MRLDRQTLLRLDRSREYLLANAAEPVRLADAADLAYYSPFHFHRLFCEAFGETPHELVVRARLDRAKELLLFSDASITDICFDAGYRSLGMFSTAFKKHTGRGPREYRETARRSFAFGHLWSHRYIPSCAMFMLGMPRAQERKIEEDFPPSQSLS